MGIEKSCCCDCNKEDPRFQEVNIIIENHKTVKGPLIPVLHKIQGLFGYLPEDMLHLVSLGLNIPMTEIYGVASFYSNFSLVPKGEHIIRVCLGTACYVKGAQLIIDELSKELGVNVGETTEDGKFTFEAARCLGACGLAPVMMIDEQVYGRLEPETVVQILEEYK